MLLYVLIAMAMVAVPLVVAVRRDVRTWTLALVIGLALISTLPYVALKFAWLAAMAFAVLGPRDEATPRSRHPNGVMSTMVVVALVLTTLPMVGASSAHAIGYEHHARRNWVQSNYTGQCLWKMHMDVYWSDQGDRFTAGPRFTKDRDNCIYHFLNWGSDVPDGGQYSYGTRWRSLKITAHWEACIVVHGVPGCTTETGVMVLQVDTDGYVQTDHWIAS